MPPAHSLGGVDRLLQRLVVRDPQDLGGGGERLPPMPDRAGGEFPPGEEPPARGPGIGARPGEMERVAQARLVLGPAGAQDARRCGAERQAPAPDARPRRVFPDDRVEAGERRAGQKGGFGVAFRRVSRARAQAGNAAGAAAEGPGVGSESARSSMRERLPHGGAFA